MNSFSLGRFRKEDSHFPFVWRGSVHFLDSHGGRPADATVGLAEFDLVADEKAINHGVTVSDDHAASTLDGERRILHAEHIGPIGFVELITAFKAFVSHTGSKRLRTARA